MRHTLIVGGGIAGLTAAYRLEQMGLPYTLIESSSQCGGKLATSRVDGFLVEGGPDSFSTFKPAAIELCRELGLESELVSPNADARDVYVWFDGALRKLPPGLITMMPSHFGDFLRTDVLSLRGKIRLALEPFISARRGSEDESIASFIRRRLGPEVLERIADPFMAGIFGGDPEDLSILATFPQMAQMERSCGSMFRAMLKSRRRGHSGRSPFVTLRGGMQTLTDALLSNIGEARIMLNRRVVRIYSERKHYVAILNTGEEMPAEDVILATPAYITAHMVQGLDPALSTALHNIEYASTATVSLGFVQSELPTLPRGSGYLIPNSQRRLAMGCTWTSSKFEERAPENTALFRIFLGGTRSESISRLEQDALITIARDELAHTLGITASPIVSKVFRWPNAMPQYNVGHAQHVAEIQQLVAAHPGLHLAGAAYKGSSVPDCIASGKAAAAEVIASAPVLTPKPSPIYSETL